MCYTKQNKKKKRYELTVYIDLDKAKTLPYSELEDELDFYWKIVKAHALNEIAELRK